MTLLKMIDMILFSKMQQHATNPPNSLFLDILDPPEHYDGDQKSWKYFLSTPMVPRILQRYHMQVYNDKIPIKMPQIFQIPSCWTFWTFLIILMMITKSWKHFLSTPMVPRILQRYHMQVYNDKIPIKMPQILQIPSFWTFWTFLIILMMIKNLGNTS